MSLKLIANWEGTEHQTFSDPFDALNPRKNKLFQYQSGNVLTGKRLKALAKSLFTKENIEAHPTVLLPSIFYYGEASHCQQAVEKLVSVPEELHWGLFAYWIVPDGNSYWSTSYYTSRGHHPSYTSGLVLLLSDSNPTYRTTCNAESWITNVKDCLTKITESYGRDLESELKWSVEHNLGLSHHFFSTLIRLFTGFKYARNAQSGDSFTPDQVWDILAGGDEAGAQLVPNVRGAAFGTLNITIRVTDRNRQPIHKLLNYSANAFEILGGPLLDKTEHDPILYGVELECSTDYTVRQIVEAGKNSFLLCKSDGSVNGNKRYPIEMVTRPMSFKMHRKQWAYFFHQLDYDNFDTSKNTNNGMHVHIDRKAFADEMHLRKFTWFITHPGHKDFMLAISERNSGSFDGYSPVPDYRGLKKGRAFIDAVQQARALRGAVNLGKSVTVEVRLFRGIVSYVSVLKNLEFVDAVLHFSRDQSMKELTIRDFFTWLSKTPGNKYVVLKKFLEEIKAEQFLKQAEVKHLVFNENDAKKILTLIEKSGITIDSEHINILNSYQPQETFILKNGKIALHPSILPSNLELSKDMAARVLRGWL